jgi:tetratricopeptide (TPR) repeat protein
MPKRRSQKQVKIAPSRRVSRPLVLLAFLFAAALAFGPAAHAPFDFDDAPAIVHNATIRTLSPPWAPLHTPPLGTAASGRPVVNMSFALNYAVNRWLGIAQDVGGGAADAAAGFRIVNIALHLATALLVLAVVRLTLRIGRVADDFRSRADTLSLIIAGLWLIHPLQTEAVNYVSQRTELMVSLCYLGTLYAAMRHWTAVNQIGDSASTSNDAHASTRWFVTAVTFSVLGMASKEVMVTAPLVILLHDRAFLSDSWRSVWAPRSRRWLYATLAATLGVTVALDLANGRAGTAGFGLGMTPLQYLLSQGWAIPHYIHLALWPDALTYDYGQTPITGVASVIGLVALAVAGVATVTLWRSDRWRWAAFLGAFFFLVLAPSSSVVPIRTEIAAERRMYLALVVVIAGVVIAGAWLFDRVSTHGNSMEQRRTRRTPWLTAAALATVGLAMLVASARRSAMYRDPTSLWANALANYPSNARAYDNVGAAMLREQPPRYRAADTMFARAISLDSTLVQPWLRRASVAAKEDRFTDAERLLLHVLSVTPNDSDAISKLSKVYLAGEKPMLAIPLLRRLAEQSSDTTALSDLGNAYVFTGQLDSAVAVLSRATTNNPDRADVRRWLGAALVESGRGREAIAPLERALAIDTTSSFTVALLAVAYAEANDGNAAERAATRLMSRGDVGALLFGARGLYAARRGDLAMRCITEVLRLDPSNQEARAAIQQGGGASAPRGRGRAG